MNITTSLRLPALVATLGTFLAATPANAHENASGAADHKFDLAIVDSIPRAGSLAAIVRSAEPGRNDVVILKAGVASPGLLFSALAQLEAERTAEPIVSANTYEFVTSARPGGPLPEAAAQRFQAMLTRVLAQPLANIGNLGPGRWLAFNDPGLRARTKP